MLLCELQKGLQLLAHARAVNLDGAVSAKVVLQRPQLRQTAPDLRGVAFEVGRLSANAVSQHQVPQARKTSESDVNKELSTGLYVALQRQALLNG